MYSLKKRINVSNTSFPKTTHKILKVNHNMGPFINLVDLKFPSLLISVHLMTTTVDVIRCPEEYKCITKR